MRTFDHDFAGEVNARLDKLAPDAAPLWGSMTLEQMLDHLTKSVRYSMGSTPPLPFVGTWYTRWILGPLMINGILAIPKNIRMPRVAQEAMDRTPVVGDVETLQAVIEEYLQAVESGAIDPPQHPAFGPIGVDGWAKFHVRHFDHHLRQFGV